MGGEVLELMRERAERLERERIENRERAARMKAAHQARKQERKCDAPPKRTSQIK